MNDDFEEDYYDDDDEGDILEDLKDTYDDIKDYKDKLDAKKNKKAGSESNSSNPQQEARNFDKQLKDKNMARSQNPQGAQQAGSEIAKKGGQEATKKAGAEAAKKVGTEAGKKVATTTATNAAAGTAAATGGAAAATGGAVAAQASIPVAGWIALAIEAAIALAIAIRKAIKKHDQKMAENGVDSKGLRRLLAASPLLIPLAIIILILILLVQSETQERVDFMSQAVDCFEGEKTCYDFMNTGWFITANNKPVIKATDWDIAVFVFEYVMAENKYYGSSGSSFMTDIVQDINDVAKKGLLDDQTWWDKIVAKFQELVDNSFLGDVQYAWHLFKWMKMEKKVFNNIDWYKQYANTGTGVATLDTILEWAKAGLLKQEPKIGFLDTSTRATWQWGFHGFDVAYLNVPIGIDMDAAIEAARPYIPSWIELYATYVATGDYDICSDMYNYYTNAGIWNKANYRYKLEITVYELLTVTRIQKVKGDEETTYYVDRGKGAGWQKSTKAEIDQLKSEGEKSFWAWLGDAITNFISKVGEVLQKVIDMIAELLGFNVKVTAKYSLIVTNGNAYKYKINQTYNIYTPAPTTTIKKKAESRNNSHYDSVTYKEEVKVVDDKGKEKTVTKEYKARFKVVTTGWLDHHIKTWENKLKYSSASITNYAEESRYRQIFMDMVEEKGYQYTLDDVAMAIEVIEAYYGEEYIAVGESIDYSALPDGAFGWPVPRNKIVSALYGNTAWYGGNHGGIDIWAVNTSDVPSASLSLVKTIDIVASQSGKVVAAYDGGCADGNKVNTSCGDGYGNYVKIQHSNNYATIYAHLSPGTIAVTVGQNVSSGQYLGKMGSSGNSSGTHLHFEIRFDGMRLDPLAFFDVVPHAYNKPYADRDNSAITMANPYRVNF